MLYCKLFNIIFADRGPHAFWLHVYQFVMSSNTFNAANKLPTVLSIINIAPIRENYPFSYYHNPYMINYFGDHSSYVIAPRVTSFLGTQLTQLTADADTYDLID